MFDMRCADEAAVMQPHSKARHEKLQTIHHQLKEDEDRWQDVSMRLLKAHNPRSPQEVFSLSTVIAMLVQALKGFVICVHCMLPSRPTRTLKPTPHGTFLGIPV